MALANQISLLLLIPISIIFLTGIFDVYLIGNNFRQLIATQGEEYLKTNIQLRKGFQMAQKCHLEFAQQHLVIYIHALADFSTRLLNTNDVTLDPNYIPLTVSYLSLSQLSLPSTFLDAIKSNGLSVSSWQVKNKTEFDQLSQSELKQVQLSSVADALARNLLLFTPKCETCTSLNFIDIFNGYEQTGLLTRIPTSLEGNPVLQANSTCTINSTEYDPRCRFWYIDTNEQNGVLITKIENVLTQNGYIRLSFICSKLFHQTIGFQGIFCGRFRQYEFDSAILNLNQTSSIFIKLHLASNEATTFYANNQTMTDFKLNSPTNNPLQSFLENNLQKYNSLTARFTDDANDYNFSKDSNYQIEQIDPSTYLILSQISVIDKMSGLNSNRIQQYENASLVDTPESQLHYNSTKKLNHVYQIFQMINRTEIMEPFTQLDLEVLNINLVFQISLIAFLILGLVIVRSTAVRLADRIEKPIIVFRNLFLSISHNDILNDEQLFDMIERDDDDQDNNNNEGGGEEEEDEHFLISTESSDDSIDPSNHDRKQSPLQRISKKLQIQGDNFMEIQSNLTSSDMTQLYEAVLNLFQMVRYSNFEYYNSNLGNSLLKWIKSLQFFKKEGDRRALGICYMNIGNIHFNCGRFWEALESYGAAIIQANYEIGMYDYNSNELSNEQAHLEIDIDILQLRFDRYFSYSKTLRMICTSQNQYFFWEEYERISKDLLRASEFLVACNKRKVLLLINYSFALSQLKKFSKANQTLESARDLITIIDQNIPMSSQINPYSISHTSCFKKQAKELVARKSKTRRQTQKSRTSFLQKSYTINTNSKTKKATIIAANPSSSSHKLISPSANHSHRKQSETRFKSNSIFSHITKKAIQHYQQQQQNNAPLSISAINPQNMLLTTPLNYFHHPQQQQQQQQLQQVDSYENSLSNTNKFQAKFSSTLLNQFQEEMPTDIIPESLTFSSHPLSNRLTNHPIIASDSLRSPSSLSGEQQQPKQQNNNLTFYLDDLKSSPRSIIFQNKHTHKLSSKFLNQSDLSNSFETEVENDDNNLNNNNNYNKEEHENMQNSQISTARHIGFPHSLISFYATTKTKQSRTQFQYESLPVEVMKTYYDQQKARQLSQLGMFKEAVTCLTKQFEEHPVFLKVLRLQSTALIEQFLLKLSNPNALAALREFKKTQSLNLRLEICAITDIYAREDISSIQMIISQIFKDILKQDDDMLGLSVITDVFEVLMTPVQLNLVNKPLIEANIRLINYYIHRYGEYFNPRPSLFISIINQIQLMTQNSLKSLSLKQERNRIGFSDDSSVKKFIVCFFQFELWQEQSLHLFLHEILAFYQIELLMLDFRKSKEIQLPTFFVETLDINSMIKLFKDPTHLYSYLSNMRACTSAFGIPLIVEKF